MSVGLLERAGRAGWGLSAQTIMWGMRPGQPRPLAPTERDLRLMLMVYEAGYLSSSQLMLLGWGRESDAASRRLLRLHDSGYLDKFRPRAATGSCEWIYRLTPLGWQTLCRCRLAEGAYKPVALYSVAYAEHDLQLAALIIHIAHTAAAASDQPLVERMPFTWLGPRTGRIDPVPVDPSAELSPAARLPAGTQLHWGQSKPGYLEPDATLIGEVAGERFAVLVEYDRTRRPHKQIDRLHRYEHFLLDGWRHTHFATHAIPPTLIYITATPGPLPALIDTADRTLTAWHAPAHTSPQQGTYPARERILFTTAERILNDDWQMQRTASAPSALRGTASATSRRVSYDFSTLYVKASASCAYG